MAEEAVHQAHDKLFKAGFADPANTAAFLRAELPEALADWIDWSGLRLEPGSFVDSHLSASASDLLFSAPVEDGDCLVYLFFEHQVREEPMLALRLLRYMVRIWEAWLKGRAAATRLPAIVPVVLAQNAKVWELSPRFVDLLDVTPKMLPELRGFIPDFSFQLIQLAAMPYEAIRGTPAAVMILRTMKAERLAQLLSDPVWDEPLLDALPRDLRELLIRYLFAADIDINGFYRSVEMLRLQGLRKETMTLAEQLLEDGLRRGIAQGIERGLEQGIEQGRLQGLRAALMLVVETRFGRIPPELVAAVNALADEEQLRGAHRRALQAETLGEFVAGL